MPLLFRSRRLRELFPAGVVALFLGAVAVAPRLFGPGAVEVLLGAVALAAGGTVSLYALLKLAVEPRMLARRQAR